MDQEQAKRTRRLEEALIAPCCWQDNVSSHQSEVAAQMRAEIARLVQEGKTDREILDMYIARYGKRVLAVPEGVTGSLLMWIPAAVILAALLWVVRVVIVWRRRAAREQAA